MQDPWRSGVGGENMLDPWRLGVSGEKMQELWRSGVGGEKMLDPWRLGVSGEKMRDLWRSGVGGQKMRDPWSLPSEPAVPSADAMWRSKACVEVVDLKTWKQPFKECTCTAHLVIVPRGLVLSCVQCMQQLAELQKCSSRRGLLKQVFVKLIALTIV
ncbi:hypothetical protein NDU88_008870 [Pleurodeles waltl]|uniref:Uncharacterized protein n=1 Tax=Pleurodeles waltl TaxID=8319 RepID=A0AAV7N675_PLEWA|nr:hypothetical protein NDU88_008870 [Pleurodeles waltl]